MRPSRLHGDLAPRSFWQEYWRGKGALAVPIPERYLFRDVFDSILPRGIHTAAELGGFPGHFGVWLAKHRGVRTDLIDIVVDQSLLNELLDQNEVDRGRVQAIEADVTRDEPEIQYDLVYSCGLVEHFTNTDAIISSHVRWLRDGGTLFIAIPNFRGLNGLVQQTFDKPNFEKHNIDCMDPSRLRAICESLGLQVERACYNKSFGVWLESPNSKPWYARLLVTALKLVGKIVGRLLPPIRAFAPYIVIIARKPSR
jgi:hypothetical protein